MPNDHPGFEKVAETIARKEHEPVKNARAELAAATRRDSNKAKRKNRHLIRVLGK